jgi:polysaccharide pyruvyl transferase WcaK-like protein
MIPFIENQFVNREFISILKEIKSCDLFILGGGELLQDLKIHYLPLLLSLTRIAQLNGKKTVIYGIGAGPIDTKLGKLLSKAVLSKVDLITVRDEKSLQALEGCGLTNVIQTADPAFGINVPKKSALCPVIDNNIDATQRYIGATFCNSLYDDDAYRKTNGPCFDWTVRRKKLASTFDDLQVLLKHQFLFFPTVKTDYCGCSKIRGFMRYKESVSLMLPTDDFKRVLVSISSLDLLIGMRLHSLILSTIMGVPFVPLSYSSKVKSFLDLLNLNELYISIEDIDQSLFKERFFSNVSEVWENREKYSGILYDHARTLKSKAIENGRIVSEILK